MADFGVDAFWLSHEPWIVPEPFTPEAGEMWSKEDIDYWIAVLERICEEAYTDPELVQDRAAQPADPPDRRRAACEDPGTLGDDLAGGGAEAARPHRVTTATRARIRPRGPSAPRSAARGAPASPACRCGGRRGRSSASTTALITAGGAPMAPASPAPFMPSGLVVQRHVAVSEMR